MKSENWPSLLVIQRLLVTLMKFQTHVGEKKTDWKVPKRMEEKRLENSFEELYCQLQEINRVLAGDRSVIKQGFFSNRRNSRTFVY